MHSDSYIYAAALLIALAWASEVGGPKAWLYLGFTLCVFVVGAHINNRRLVYVDVAMALIAMGVVMRRTPLKRAVMKFGLVWVPLLPFYLAAGWNSTPAVSPEPTPA